MIACCQTGEGSNVSSVVAACDGYTRNAVTVNVPDPVFRCVRCLAKAQPIDRRTMKEVKINDEMLKAVPELCYLLVVGMHGFELGVVTRCTSGSGRGSAGPLNPNLRPNYFIFKKLEKMT